MSDSAPHGTLSRLWTLKWHHRIFINIIIIVLILIIICIFIVNINSIIIFSITFIIIVIIILKEVLVLWRQCLSRHSKILFHSAVKFPQGGSSVIPGRDDAENFRKLTAAMDILDFSRDEQDTIHRILASVLHIGNVYFKTVQVRSVCVRIASVYFKTVQVYSEYLLRKSPSDVPHSS